MTPLADVNVVIALLDGAHVGHALAHEWLSTAGRSGFALCPVSEIGAFRVLSSPRYSNGPLDAAWVAAALRQLRTRPACEWWEHRLSISDPGWFRWSGPLNGARVTDAYLLATAVSRGGFLVTLDQSIRLEDVVPARREHLQVLATAG